MKPSFEIVLSKLVKIGHIAWFGRLKIVDCSHRGVLPDQYYKMANVVFAGENVYQDLYRLASKPA
jgi:hypothetical protein